MSTAVLPPPALLQAPADEEPLCEVVEGSRLELPDTCIYRKLITKRIFLSLKRTADAASAGTVHFETPFLLDTDANIRCQPDVAYISQDRWPLDREVPEVGDWEVVPDLCVEVTSPNDLFDEVMGKVLEYFQKGVREVWVVWPPQRQVYVYYSPDDMRRLTAKGTLSTPLLPGFSLPLKPLFQQTPR